MLYADTMTDSMKRAMEETERRRERQMAYNQEYGITPESIKKSISDVLSSVTEKDYYTVPAAPDVEEAGRVTQEELPAYIEQLEKEMRAAAKRLEFERAAELRDRIREMENRRIGVVEG